jgi:hypothetical protein
MPRKLEYHVTVAVPVTIEDDGTFKVGKPYSCEMGTPLNSDTFDVDTDEWDELHRMELPGDVESTTVAKACEGALWANHDKLRALVTDMRREARRIASMQDDADPALVATTMRGYARDIVRVLRSAR